MPKSKTLRAMDRHPPGTSVSVYPATAFRPGGAPGGTPLTTASVGAGGALALSNLPDDRMLVMYALVAGEHRYVHTTTYA